MAKDWCDIRKGCINPAEYWLVFIILLAFLYFAYTTPFTAIQLFFGVFYILFAIDYFAKQLNMGGISFIIFLAQWGLLLSIGKFFFYDKIEYSNYSLGLLVLSIIIIIYTTKRRWQGA